MISLPKRIRSYGRLEESKRQGEKNPPCPDKVSCKLYFPHLSRTLLNVYRPYQPTPQ